PSWKNLIGSLDSSGLSAGANVTVAPDPKLSALGNYGGRTPTMLPLAGSPALDKGGKSALTDLITDQRGSLRKAGLTIDIGAVERGSIVTKSADSGAGSLRALIASNTGTIINFDPALNPTTINLASTITLDKDIEINAEGLASGITVN